jgi:murein endopeptidase
MFPLYLYAALGFALAAPAAQPPLYTAPAFQPCEPSAEALIDETGGAEVGFCAEWNPEFPFNGSRCCAPPPRRRRGNRCLVPRRRASFCDERTEEQVEYAEAVASGRIPDALAVIADALERRPPQAYCGVNNGFLANGRPVIGTEQNRIVQKSPHRCSYYGTEGMAGLLEWLGRQVKQKYAEPPYEKTKLVVGDISAPRGGCLSGPSGRKGHASHTNGQDADVGFLVAKPGRESPILFHNDFDVAANWWLVKNIFKNPYACVKVIFLDRRLISKLGKYASDDEDWPAYKRFLKHVRGHRNHFHVRVGDTPGLPGCSPDAHPELEEEEDSAEDPQQGDEPIPEPNA